MAGAGRGRLGDVHGLPSGMSIPADGGRTPRRTWPTRRRRRA